MQITNHKWRPFISLPIWGKEYTEFFERFICKNLFSDDNLKFLRAASIFKFALYTEKEYSLQLEGILEAHGLLKNEFEVIPLFGSEFDPIADKYNSPVKYNRVSAAHADSFKRTKGQYSHIIPIYGDMIVSKDFFRNVFERLKYGDEIIVGMAPPINTQKFLSKFDNKKSVLDNDEITKIAIEYLHPLMRDCVLDKQISLNPIGPFIGIRYEDGYLFSCLHLHTILMSTNLIQDPERFDFAGTIDGDWIYRLGLHEFNVCAVEDFSELPIVSFMDDDFPDAGNQGWSLYDYATMFCIQEPDFFANPFKGYRFLLSKGLKLESVPQNIIRKFDLFWQNVACSMLTLPITTGEIIDFHKDLKKRNALIMNTIYPVASAIEPELISAQDREALLKIKKSNFATNITRVISIVLHFTPYRFLPKSVRIKFISIMPRQLRMLVHSALE